MKRIIILISLLLFLCSLSGCVSVNNQYGRYQIYQSTLNARDQFLLDTLTGKVYQLVNNNGTTIWSEMDVYGFTPEHYNKDTTE